MPKSSCYLTNDYKRKQPGLKVEKSMAEPSIHTVACSDPTGQSLGGSPATVIPGAGSLQEGQENPQPSSPLSEGNKSPT